METIEFGNRTSMYGRDIDDLPFPTAQLSVSLQKENPSKVVVQEKRVRKKRRVHMTGQYTYIMFYMTMLWGQWVGVRSCKKCRSYETVRKFQVSNAQYHVRRMFPFVFC